MDNRNKHSDVDIFTYDGDTYTVINIPWPHIIQNKVYLNQITHMDAVERQEYDDLLDGTGTIIRFKNNPIFNQLLQKQFKEQHTLPQRIGFIFGNLDVNIYLKQEDELYDLELHDYFKDDPQSYHNGISCHTIGFYRDDKQFRYIYIGIR